MNTSTPAVSKQTIAVNEVIFHQNCHYEEYLSYVLIYLYGQEMFPGFRAASVRFIEADIRGTDEELDALGIIPIGCCGGRFDEHRGRNGEKERIPGECATTLVAKYLGIMDRPEVKQLIEDAFYFDTHAGCRSTQLAELVKSVHRYHKDEYFVMNWVNTAIRAIIKQERFHYAQVPEEKNLLELFKAEIAKDFFNDDPRARQDLLNRVHESMKLKDECPTQLAHVLEALYRSPLSTEEIEKWLDVAMSAMNADQLDFWQQVDVLKKQAPVEIRTLLDRRECSLKLMICNGDSQSLQKAARSIGNDIVLVRQSSGNVQIFIDTTIRGLNLANVARMIRFMELPLDKRDGIDWRSLGCEGKYAGVDQWHYFKKGEMLFNGSDTHKAPATRIATQALVDVIKYGLHPWYLSRWCTDRGIRMNPSKSATVAV